MIAIHCLTGKPLIIIDSEGVDMTYVDGFVTAVPSGGQEAYLDFTHRAWKKFRDLGAISAHEAWGDEVPAGQHTDFHRAVDLRSDETVVFSWIIWPDKTLRDAAMAVMMSDAMAKELGPLPFDGKRMIYGGFKSIFNGEGTK